MSYLSPEKKLELPCARRIRNKASGRIVVLPPIGHGDTWAGA